MNLLLKLCFDCIFIIYLLIARFQHVSPNRVIFIFTDTFFLLGLLSLGKGAQ